MRKGFDSDTFMLGVNYWPGRHGVRMWREFDPAEIDEEFAQIRDMGMDTVRVFPLWDDFQPIYELPGCYNIPQTIGFRHDWNVTPAKNPEMMDPCMLERFDYVVACARKYDLKLIVALLTAWMSGTLFNPSWRGGRNLFSDPTMLKYQILYCRAFAKRYANTPEIIAWEYGNEQNCADTCASPDTAWVWMHALAAELKLHDPETPMASGMHSQVNVASDRRVWKIEDCADAVELLTTHPYPPFTKGTFMESPTALRANLHGTAESRYVADLGHRPVLCEETGSLGNSVLSEPLSAAYLRMRLYSLLANGVEGCLWWCYSDFACKEDLPYRDVQMENDGLGLTRITGEVKPTGEVMSKFSKVVKSFGGKLPEMERQTAIIVSDLRDDWPSAYNCFALCVQAGLAPEFVRPDRDCLDKYKLLLAPSLYDCTPISGTAWDNVTNAVKNGAVLYASGAGVSLNNMRELFGITEMEKLPLKNKSAEVRFKDFFCNISADFRNHIIACDSEAVAWYEDNTPAMVKHCCGKGTAYFLSMPLESSLAATPYALDDIEAYKLYQELKECAGVESPADFPDVMCERYWNSDKPGHGFLTVINHRREKVQADLIFSGTVESAKVLAGEGRLDGKTLQIEPLNAVIMEITFK